MWFVAVTKLLVLCSLLAFVQCVDEDYYWRPWTPGSPPADAVTVRDYRGVSYIVQAYVPRYGTYIGQVFVNQHEVDLAVSNATIPASTNMLIGHSTYLKVLCAHDLEKLSWYPANQKTLGQELVTATIDPVAGGVTVQELVIYIGRSVDVNRQVNIGSIILEYDHYHNSGKTFTLDTFEILVINA